MKSHIQVNKLRCVFFLFVDSKKETQPESLLDLRKRGLSKTYNTTFLIKMIAIKKYMLFKDSKNLSEVMHVSTLDCDISNFN